MRSEYEEQADDDIEVDQEAENKEVETREETAAEEPSTRGTTWTTWTTLQPKLHPTR